MDNPSYIVKMEKFEGPLDVLLSLIEKHKLQINDIALATIANGYIEYVRELTDFPLADSAQFVLIAATLVLIKSKSLLPLLSLTEEEDHNIEDLQDRLRVYQECKEQAIGIAKLFGSRRLFSARPKKQTQIVFAPDKRVTPGFIKSVMYDMLAHMSIVEILPKTIVKKVMSLEEAIVRLTDRISKSLTLSFREMAHIDTAEKVSIIVTFLAMLELVKQGVITVTQDALFQEIEMHTHTVGIPKY